MANLIMKISGLKILTTSKVEPINIEENGTYAPPTGVVGFNPVTVDVKPPLQEKTTTQNGEVVADAEYYGLSKVNVDVPAPPLSKRTITVNGTYNASNEGLNGYSEVEVDVPDNSGDEENSITFYDYDGTVLRRINLDQLPITTEDLPTPPPHEYLIFSGWTHTLEDINGAEDMLQVGATYDTVGGKTYAFIEVNNRTGYSVPIYYNKTDDSTLMISVFNDETEEKVLEINDIGSGNIVQVLYLPEGVAAEYRIEMSISSGSGSYSLGNGNSSSIFIGGSNAAYRQSVLKIYMGSENIFNITDYSFQSMFNLRELVITKNVSRIGTFAFEYLRSLKAFILFNSQMSNISGTFRRLNSVKVIILPKDTRRITSQVMQENSSIQRISLPIGLERLDSQAFRQWYQLKSISIPIGVSIIDSSLAYDCWNLEEVLLGENINRIMQQAFYNCYNLKMVNLTDVDAVPILDNVSAFSGVPINFKIRVKQEMLHLFKTATNWSVYADNIIGVEV